MSFMSFISFDYSKINEINTDFILNKTLKIYNLPECIVKYIGSYLFPEYKKIMKFFYEQKCDDYLITKETTFKIIKID